MAPVATASRGFLIASFGMASTLSRSSMSTETSPFMPGLSRPSWFVEVHEHREHRDVLLHDGLRLDLLDDAAEAAVGIRVDRDVRRLARMHVADVGLVEQRANAHDAEVGHLARSSCRR